MVQNQNTPGTRSEHAGAKTNSIGSNDTTNIGFTSVPSKQKSTQKGSLLKSTQKTLLGTLVFVSFVLFLLRLFCNNLFYNTIELVILFLRKIVSHPTQTDALLPLLHDLSITYYKYTNIISNIFFLQISPGNNYFMYFLLLICGLNLYIYQTKQTVY